MSDDHEALARAQEREAADMEHESEDLAEEIESAKGEAAELDSTLGIATPDPDVDDQSG